MLGLVALMLGAAAPVPAAAASNDTTPAHARAGAPVATFHPVASLEGIAPSLQPWSPAGHLLVLANGALQIFDADSAQHPPRPIMDGALQDVVWSPDGTWVAGRFVLNAGHRNLVAAPISGAGAVEIAAGIGHGHVLWGSNGKLCYWFEEERHLVGYDPPAAWKQAHATLPSPADQFLQFMRDPQTPWIAHLQASGDSAAVSWFPAETTGATRLFLLDVFDRGRAVLIKTESVVAVTDGAGHVRAQFGRSTSSEPPGLTRTSFQPFSASEDGRFLVGTAELTDGHRLVESKVTLADVEGRWMTPVAGIDDGEAPHLSSDGRFLEYIGVGDRRIHVGTLDVAGGTPVK